MCLSIKLARKCLTNTQRSTSDGSTALVGVLTTDSLEVVLETKERATYSSKDAVANDGISGLDVESVNFNNITDVGSDAVVHKRSHPTTVGLDPRSVIVEESSEVEKRHRVGDTPDLTTAECIEARE